MHDRARYAEIGPAVCIYVSIVKVIMTSTLTSFPYQHFGSHHDSNACSASGSRLTAKDMAKVLLSCASYQSASEMRFTKGKKIEMNKACCDQVYIRCVSVCCKLTLMKRSEFR